jgi:hypothetical protein
MLRRTQLDDEQMNDCVVRLTLVMPSSTAPPVPARSSLADPLVLVGFRMLTTGQRATKERTTPKNDEGTLQRWSNANAVAALAITAGLSPTGTTGLE